MKKIKKWLKYLRAIATIAVIIIHVSAPMLYRFNHISITAWNIGNFYDSMSRFCVPIFFMLSGALLLNKDYTIKDFIRKRFFKIIPPFIFWSFIYIIYNIFVLEKEFNSIIELGVFFIHRLFKGSEYHLWFVYTIIGLYLVVPIIRKWIKYSTKNEILYFLILWGVTTIYGIPHLDNYLPKIYLINFSGYMGYMILGYYLSELKSVNKKISIFLFSLGAIVTMLGTYYLTNRASAFSGPLYNYLMPNVLISSIGIFLLVKDLNIKSIIIQKVLTTIDKYSYGIYLIHPLVLSLLIKVGLEWDTFNPIFSIPLIAMITLFLSTIIIYFGKKLKYVSNLIG